MTFQLVAVGIGSRNEATKMSSYGQVQPFDMASAHKARLGASASGTCYRPCNSTRGTHPVGASDIRRGIELNQLRKMDANIEVGSNRINIGAKSISRELKHSFGSRPQITHKVPSAVSIPVADVMRDDEFGFAVQRNPRPRTAPFLRGITAQPFFMASHKAVKLISLNQVGLNSANRAIKQSLTLFSPP